MQISLYNDEIKVIVIIKYIKRDLRWLHVCCYSNASLINSDSLSYPN